MGILDLFFPKYCCVCCRWGEYLCTNCFSTLSFEVKLLCCVCNKPSLDGLTHPPCRGKYTLDGAFCGLSYKQTINTLVYAFKYPPYIADLAGFLSRLMYESLIQKEIIGELLNVSQGILVPIPLHRKKERLRGYNQSELLAKELGKIAGFSVYKPLLRIKETAPQFGLSREDRKKNISDAFSVKERMNISSRQTYFLIDDVLTTGSTLVEAANVLKRAGAKRVYGLCLAREQNE